MAALHEALKSLAPCDFTEIPTDNLKTLLSEAFTQGQTIVDSVPIAPPTGSPVTSEGRSRSTSNASSASEISASSARSTPPPAEIEVLQKEWKPVKLNARDNPLGMSVYKMGGKDGRGSWFARRSVHEGLGFKKWKKAMEREFPETMKVQGGPGEGNIRGIGGETRVEYKEIEGVGKLEVYLLSAQFPGPTAPRDFVTMFLTSDQALRDANGEEVPRHFMVISKPCIHPDTPPRDGYIRGQYESVEFIREIPIHKKPTKSASTTQLDKGHTRQRSSTLGKEAILRNATKKHSPPENGTDEPAGEADSESVASEGGRARGRTISFDHSRGSEAKGESLDVPKEDDESECNPIEWIMITRSDPGGSVPRFLIDRGTPGGIVNDASKFLDWACGKDMEDFEDENETPAGDDDDFKPERPHRHDTDLHNFQTNGHLAGLEEEPNHTSNSTPPSNSEPISSEPPAKSPRHTPSPPALSQEASNGGLYGMVAGGIGAAGGFIANHTPQMIADRFTAHPATHPNDHESTKTSSTRRASTSSISTISSTNSFTSALDHRLTSQSQVHANNSLTKTETETEKLTASDATLDETAIHELQKLESKKRKLDEKLAAVRSKETSKVGEDTSSAKEEESIRKASEKHSREVKKQEEKYQKELGKLQQKKEKEEKKAEERRRKGVEKDEKMRLQRECEELKQKVAGLEGKVTGLEKDRESLKGQVGELQRENTMLAARVGRMGGVGEEVLREVREEVERGNAAGRNLGGGGGGRARASSLKALASRPVGLVRKGTALANDGGGGGGEKGDGVGVVGGNRNGNVVGNGKENHLPHPGFERVGQ